MNIETRSKALNRKRNRQPQFDLNRTIPHELPKVRRTQFQDRRMSNPSESNIPHFVDLSGTINTSAQNPNVNESNNNNSRLNLTANGSRENISPNVREMVVDEALIVQRSLEDKVRQMVQGEMSDIKKSIADLTKCVMELSKNTPHNLNTVVPNQQTSDPLTSETASSSIPLNIGNVVLPFPRPGETGTNPHYVDPLRIRVDKLGVVFDGNPDHLSIDDFIFRLEHLQMHYLMPWSEVIRDFHLLVTGCAREWYWLYVRTHRVVDWPGLRHALLNQYQIARSNLEIITDLVQRKQHPGESIDNYFQAIGKIRSKLVQPIQEFDLIKIVKSNIKESIRRIVYPITVSSIEQLRVECNEAERQFCRRDDRISQPTMRPVRGVNEIYVEEEERFSEEEKGLNNFEIAAINIQRKQPLICWNCRQPGHVFMDCPTAERTLFCYKCGRPNVITPRCPICQAGNQSKSLGTKGDHCSSENPSPSKN